MFLIVYHWYKSFPDHTQDLKCSWGHIFGFPKQNIESLLLSEIICSLDFLLFFFFPFSSSSPGWTKRFNEDVFKIYFAPCQIPLEPTVMYLIMACFTSNFESTHFCREWRKLFYTWQVPWHFTFLKEIICMKERSFVAQKVF